MKSEAPADKRQLKTERLTCDLAVAGGGLSGVCCAITAARAGLKVVLVQDRPVLGGNASSEVRLWVLGATSHMGNNNRWAREGGVLDELLVENLYRNPEGNALLFDTVLLEKVVNEPNITLLLNTAVHDLDKSGPDTIRALRAFCPQNETVYEIAAPLFCDATGDGVVGFLAGAAFRVGAEGRAEFGEGFAPAMPSQELLGHSMYFFSKDTGRPVRFVPPSFALQDITQIPRWRDIKAGDYGCRFWWLEWGGALDTIHDSEKIKWELWRVVYGVWNHIKNSGLFPEAATMTLEWVGTIPGKRESRRFEGDYILTQQDLIEQRRHADAVSFGGWAIDLHPVDGVYSPQPGCIQWHSKGVYQIPYRCLYSRNITNLFLGGRLISASHVAFGSTRVMCTCAHNGQAVGIAAALCLRQGLTPRALGAEPHIAGLQRELLRAGQFIPDVTLADPGDLAKKATLSASSEFKLATLTPCGATLPLAQSWAMMLPVQPGPMPHVTFTLDVAQATTLRAELRVSSKPRNHTPDTTLAVLELPLQAGAGQNVTLDFDQSTGMHGQDGRATPGGTGVPPVNGVATEPSAAACAAQRDTAILAVGPNTDIQIRQGAYLPHWEHTGATYAVTFRLEDALPHAVLTSWQVERENTMATARQQGRSLSEHEEERLAFLYSEKIEQHLDAGAGACWLRQEPVARIVAEALRHFDGERYRLHAWCVMPNHVHAVLTPLEGHKLADILHSWKSFTAKQANTLLGRTGAFWQPEYYDHLIRNAQQFAHSVDYVLNNPAQAGLQDWTWMGCSEKLRGTDSLPVQKSAEHGQDGRATQSVMIDQPRYAFVCLMANDALAAHLSDVRATGVLAVSQKFNRAVAKTPRQEPPPGIGIESFEFWIPQRRPEGKNLALQLHPPLACFGAANVLNGKQRPTRQPNAWLAALNDRQPALTLRWQEPQTIARVELAFDPDFDHAMESVLMGHPERVTPFCVRTFRIRDAAGQVLADYADNHQARVIIQLPAPVQTDRLTLELTAPGAQVPAVLFEIRCYAE